MAAFSYHLLVSAKTEHQPLLLTPYLWFPGHEYWWLFASSQFTLAFFGFLCPCACACRSSSFSTFFILNSLVLLPRYKAWQLFGYLTSHKHYCLKLSISIFDLLQSGFYFLYKFPPSLKALVSSFWSGLLISTLAIQLPSTKSVRSFFSKNFNAFFPPYPSNHYLRE